jgi:hypothetical protein
MGRNPWHLVSRISRQRAGGPRAAALVGSGEGHRFARISCSVFWQTSPNTQQENPKTSASTHVKSRLTVAFGGGHVYLVGRTGANSGNQEKKE